MASLLASISNSLTDHATNFASFEAVELVTLSAVNL